MELQKLAEQLKNLSQEDIAQIESIINKPKKISFPMTWEDALRSVKETDVYYPKFTGNVEREGNGALIPHMHTSVVSEQRAKSVLAYCKLSVIIDVMNSQYLNPNQCYNISLEYEGLLIYPIETLEHYPLTCYSKEIAIHVVTTFPDLLKDYFMINN